MPGNEVGDRVHNFFAQDNLSQGQHNSQSLDGNWPVLNNNLWAGSQRPAGILSSNAKNFSLQQQGTKFRYCSWIFFDTSINCFSYYCCVSSLAFFFSFFFPCACMLCKLIIFLIFYFLKYFN